jgi:hypothetical protein
MKSYTLSEIAEYVCDGDDYAASVKEFIDALTVNKNYSEAIKDEPKLTGNPTFDAHLAGLAEHIAFLLKVDCPSWTESKSRFLSNPVFFGGKHSRKIIIETTPNSMSRRNIFCGNTKVSSIRQRAPSYGW